jgi:hypothetical protein
MSPDGAPNATCADPSICFRRRTGPDRGVPGDGAGRWEAGALRRPRLAAAPGRLRTCAGPLRAGPPADLDEHEGLAGTAAPCPLVPGRRRGCVATRRRRPGPRLVRRGPCRLRTLWRRARQRRCGMVECVDTLRAGPPGRVGPGHGLRGRELSPHRRRDAPEGRAGTTLDAGRLRRCTGGRPRDGRGAGGLRRLQRRRAGLGRIGAGDHRRADEPPRRLDQARPSGPHALRAQRPGPPGHDQRLERIRGLRHPGRPRRRPRVERTGAVHCARQRLAGADRGVPAPDRRRAAPSRPPGAGRGAAVAGGRRDADPRRIAQQG